MSDEGRPPETARDGDSTLLREGGKLSALTMVSRVLGLVREMTKAAFMGTGPLAEAFTVAFIIPNFMRRLFAEGSVTVAFIPTFSGILGEKDEAKTREFLSATFTVLLVLVCATVALGMAAAPWITSLVFYGSEAAETVVLTRMMFPFLALVSVAALLQGILNSIGVFAPSGLGPILFNLCFIGLPYLVGGWTANPARAMAIGVLAGGLAQALCQLPAVLRAGYRFGFIGPRRALANPGMRKVLSLVAPTILGMAAYQLNDLVCTSLASSVRAAAGIQYSIRLQELILGIFAVSAGTVLLPRLTASAGRGDWAGYSRDLGSVMRTMILVTIPIALFSMIAGREMVTLLFRARAFGEDSVALTTSVFFFHMLGILFIALNRVIAPAFYARSDALTPTWAGMASFGVNIALAFAFIGPFKGPGIAMALSISSAVNTLILAAALRRSAIEGIREAFTATLRYGLRILALSAIAGLPLYFARPWILGRFAAHPSRLVAAGLPLILESLLYGALGIGLLALSRDKIAASLVARFRRGSRA
ncbi:MAG TPA: murein biosynthesis integral membrane protein MurJ [Spirochaetia bacterium]|nr:murein biosynthesis integral membrane protein MurJ [Spirochaetia bacterium]